MISFLWLVMAILLLGCYLMIGCIAINIAALHTNKSASYYKPLVLVCFFLWPIALVLFGVHFIIVEPFFELRKILRGN